MSGNDLYLIAQIELYDENMKNIVTENFININDVKDSSIFCCGYSLYELFERASEYTKNSELKKCLLNFKNNDQIADIDKGWVISMDTLWK